MTPLFREYLAARRTMRSRPDLTGALKAYGLPSDGFGISRRSTRTTTRPAPPGNPPSSLRSLWTANYMT